MATRPPDRIVTVVGESMRFLIAPGEEVRVVSAKPEELEAGDVALLFDVLEGGKPLVHRVIGRVAGALRTRGDASATPDREDGMILVGRVEAVRKRGRWRTLEGSRSRRFWRAVTIYSPCALALLRGFLAAARRGAACADVLLGLRGRIACARWGEGMLIPLALRVLEGPACLLLGGREPEPPRSGRELVRFGRLDHDETWEGAVRVIGDVVVGPRARLTVAPGARVVFESERRYRAPYPFGRLGREGRRWVGGEEPRLLVYGRLVIRGAADAPVRLEGPRWGGLHVLAAGEAVIGPRVEIAGAGVGAWDRARLSLEDCVVSGRAEGVAARGRARVALRDVVVSASEGAALVVEDDAALGSAGARARGEGGPAFRATGGSARLEGGELASDGDAAVLAIRAGRVELAGARAVSRAQAAVSVGRGGRVELRDCRLESAEGGAMSLAAGGVLRGARVRVSGGAHGVGVGPGARLDLADSEVRAARAALTAEDGDVRLTSVRLESLQEGGVFIHGGAALLTDCALSAAAGAALTVEGAGRARVAGSTVSCAAGSAIKLAEGGVLRARESRFSSVQACLVLDGAAVFLENVDLSSGESAAAAACGGRLELRHGAARGERALSVKGATLRIEGTRLEGRSAGLELEESSASLKRTSVSALTGHGLALRDATLSGADLVVEAALGACEALGGRLSLTRVRLHGGDFGLRARGTNLDISRARLSGRARGLEAEGGVVTFSRVALRSEAGLGMVLRDARLSAVRSRAQGRLGGLKAQGGSIRLSRVALLSAEGHGVLLRGGDFSGADVAISAGRGACEVSGGGTLRLKRARLRGADFGVGCFEGETILEALRASGSRLIGVDLSSGRHRLRDVSIENCGEPGLSLGSAALVDSRDVVVAGTPWRDPGELPLAGGRLYRLLLAGVLATRRRPVLRELYRAAGAAALALVAAAAARSRALSGVLVYRGWTEGDWQAGVSDIDLHCVLAAAGEEDEGRALAAFLRSYRRLRSVLPFLGELMVCSGEELEGYVGDGGARAEEFVRTARLVWGRAAVPPAPGRANPVAGAAEALHAYTRMMAVRFPSVVEPRERSRQNLRKAFLDVLRYARGARDGASVAPRADYEAALRGERGDLALALDADDRDALCAAAFAALDEAGAALLTDTAQPASPPAAPSAPAAPADRLEEAFRRETEAFSAGLGLREAGFSLEDGQRFELILPSGLDKGLLAAACRDLEELRRRSSFLRTLPLVLPRAAWEFLQQSPYRHHPTAYLDAQADGRASTGGRGLDGFVRLRRAVAPVQRRLSAARSREAVVQSLRHLDVCWRDLLFTGEPEPAAYHLYSRALGLRLLLEAGVRLPFTQLETVVSAARESFPDARAWLDRLDLSALRSGRERPAAHYVFISRQLARARECAARGERAAT